MTLTHRGLTRRRLLAAGGAGLLLSGCATGMGIGSASGIDARVTKMAPSPQRLAALAAAVADGTLDVEVSTVLSPAQIAEGHRMLEDGHTRGKIVLDLRGESA